jgi:hypothetical protein
MERTFEMSEELGQDLSRCGRGDRVRESSEHELDETGGAGESVARSQVVSQLRVSGAKRGGGFLEDRIEDHLSWREVPRPTGAGGGVVRRVSGSQWTVAMIRVDVKFEEESLEGSHPLPLRERRGREVQQEAESLQSIPHWGGNGDCVRSRGVSSLRVERRALRGPITSSMGRSSVILTEMVAREEGGGVYQPRPPLLHPIRELRRESQSQMRFRRTRVLTSLGTS